MLTLILLFAVYCIFSHIIHATLVSTGNDKEQCCHVAKAVIKPYVWLLSKIK